MDWTHALAITYLTAYSPNLHGDNIQLYNHHRNWKKKLHSSALNQRVAVVFKLLKKFISQAQKNLSWWIIVIYEFIVFLINCYVLSVSSWSLMKLWRVSFECGSAFVSRPWSLSSSEASEVSSFRAGVCEGNAVNLLSQVYWSLGRPREVIYPLVNEKVLELGDLERLVHKNVLKRN